MEEAAVMMVGLNPERVFQGIALLEGPDSAKRKFRMVDDYTSPNVSDKIVRIIVSYTDYVRRVIWQQS